MKILPMMSKGVVFVHEDGKTFEMAPVQVFISGSGRQTVIRIGHNTLYFNQDGTFDGSEARVTGIHKRSPEAELIREAFELQGKNKGLPPDEPYFVPGTPGYDNETRPWPTAKQEADTGDVYTVSVGKQKGS